MTLSQPDALIPYTASWYILQHQNILISVFGGAEPAAVNHVGGEGQK